MVFLVDDVAYFQFKPTDYSKDKWPFNGPFHLILNVAMGGSWGGQIDPTLFTSAKSRPGPAMEVDFVRVFQERDRNKAGGGCTDPVAQNTDLSAKFNDGSCKYSSKAAPRNAGNPPRPARLGCATKGAKNYDSKAAFGVPGSCKFCNGRMKVFFILDMTNKPLPSGKKKIYLNGDWKTDSDGWIGGAIELTQEGNTPVYSGNSNEIADGEHAYAIYASAGKTSGDKGWGYNLMKNEGKHTFFLDQTRDCYVTLTSCGGNSFSASQGKWMCKGNKSPCKRDYSSVGGSGRPAYAAAGNNRPAACDDAAKRACSAANKQDCSGNSKACGGCKSGYKASGDKCVADTSQSTDKCSAAVKAKCETDNMKPCKSGQNWCEGRREVCRHVI